MKRLSTVLGMCLLLVVPLSAASQGTISGGVQNQQSGQPIPSVQIFIQSLDLGVLSQPNGRYVLPNVPAGTHTVTASRIGFQTVTQSVTVGAGAATVIQDFSLTEAVLGLDEIIVTGQAGGTQRRAIGNVVATIDAADLAEVSPSASMEQFFGNRVAGVQMIPGSGSVGYDTQRIRIRGNSSAALKNDPIIYIDGVRMNSLAPETVGYAVRQSRLNDINPADIESIEIIKGPAASTLYGTEASNGVIQIITKRGVAGDASFDASLESGLSYMVDPAGKVDEYYGFSPTTGNIISGNLYDAEEVRLGAPVYSYGPNVNANISVRGGTDLIRYFGSINRQDQTGTVNYNFDKRTTGRLNLGFTASEVLDADLNMSFSERVTQHDDDLYRALTWGNPISNSAFGGIDTPNLGYSGEPVDAKRMWYEEGNSIDRRTASLTLNYNPTDWLSHRLVTGADVTHDRSTVLYKKNALYNGSSGRDGRKISGRRETRLVSFDYSTSANFRLMGDRLGGVSSLGLQYYKTTDDFAQAEGRGFATPTLSTVGAAAVTEGTEDIVENATVGVYIQQQFDWQERLFVTAAVRGDDNSAFGTDYDAAIYPKLSGAWVISEEGFWNLDSVSEFRLRAAWGEAGQQPDIFAASRLFQAQAGPGDVAILTPTDFGNPDLAPETGSEIEAGFDASLFNDRVGLNFTGYWRTTKDAIVSQPLPLSLGFASNQLVNIGEVKNWGTETELNIQMLVDDPLRWDVAVAFSTNQNEVTDLGGVDAIPVRRGRFHVEGYPLATIFAPKVIGANFVSGNRGAATNIMCDGGTGADGRQQGGVSTPCDDANFVYIGHTDPSWQTTFSSTLTFLSNWTIYSQVDVMGGHTIFNDGIGAQTTSFVSTRCSNFQDDLQCMAQRAVARTLIGVRDGGFARVRELSLRYVLPQGMADRLGFDRASVTAGWRNPVILWFPGKYAGEYANMKYRERIPDPEENLPSEEFGGEASSTAPPLSYLSLTVRASF